MGFAKVFEAILDSSINDEDVAVRWLWITLLVKSNKYGQVQSTLTALARAANISREDTDRGMKILMSPDQNSTSEEEEGRRVINLGPNLWQLVNFAKYRNLRDEEAEREKVRERVRKHRERKKAADTVTECNENETKCNDIAEAEAYSDAEAEPHTEGISSGEEIPVVEPWKADHDDLLSVANPDPNHLGALWNHHAKPLKLPCIRVPINISTGSGKDKWAKAGVRLKEHPDLAEWDVVIQRIVGREYCQGANKDGWVASFEFLCRVRVFDDHFDGKFSRVGAKRGYSDRPDPTVGEHRPEDQGESARELRNSQKEFQQALTFRAAELKSEGMEDAAVSLAGWSTRIDAADPGDVFELVGKMLRELFDLLTESAKEEIREDIRPRLKGLKSDAMRRTGQALQDKAVRELLKIPRYE